MTESPSSDTPLLPPELNALVELRDAGWRITPVRAEDGEVTRVDGMHVMPDPFNPDADWVEVLMVLDAANAKGLRQNPDGEVVWAREGDLVDVVDGFLDLPKPGEPNAPRLVISAGPLLWTP
jgi:hypothetical protein